MRRVAACLPRVLLFPAGRGRLGHLLKRNFGMEVHGLESRPEQARTARALLDSLCETPLGTAPLPYTEGYFDLLIVRDFHGTANEFSQALRLLRPLLSDCPLVYVLSPNPLYWRGEIHGTLSPEETAQTAATADLRTLGFWMSEDTAFLTAPLEGSRVSIEGRSIDIESAADREAKACADVLWVFAPPRYSLLEHAQSLCGQGRPDWAYELLAHTPPQQEESMPAKAALHTARLEYLLGWVQSSTPPDELPYFARGMHHFRIAEACNPGQPRALQAMAAFWRRIGGESMAQGLLRSTGAWEEKAVHVDASPEIAPQERARTEAMRILFVLPARPHYGLDVIYDGLCKVLGPEAVVDFPPKPSLHGVPPGELANYPCSYHWPAHDFPEEEVLDQLRAGRFSAVVYGDCENALDGAWARRVAESAQGTPFYLLDANDECTNLRGAIQEILGRQTDGYFKREMLSCVDYGPGAFPMPFALSEEQALREFDKDRPNDLFWAGHRNAYRRRFYLERIEEHLGLRLDATYTAEKYQVRLRQARIGLNLFGFGFDTVRYWELPAQGCLLLSERPPIRIPFNFEDGKSAVFFSDAPELIEKLDYYLAHPAESETIARAGHALYWERHTATARAEQLLARIRTSGGSAGR